MPSPVSDCGVAIVNGRLIVIGGESAGAVFSTVRAFDLTTSAWSTLPNLAAAKPGHNASTRTLQIRTLHG